MKNHLIPKTDLMVSPICLGTMTFGTPVGEKDAVRIVHWGLDNRVNFIDTANMYEGYDRFIGSAGGVAEEIIGAALKGRRSEAIVATKVGMKVGDQPVDEGTSPEAIRIQLDRSLKRMQTDYIDIYYLHRPDPGVEPVEMIGALNEAINQGKIRYYGISNYSAEQTADLLKIADENNLPRPVIHQPPFSLLKPDSLKDILPLCEKEHIGAAPYQVLQGGLLTGKYRRGKSIPESSRKSEKESWLPDFTDEMFDALEKIEEEARRNGESLLEYTLRKTLVIPAVVAVITGVKRIDQLENLTKAVSER